VRYANAVGVERVVSIVGTDEVDLDRDVRAARQRRPLTEGPVFQSKGYYGHRFEESPPSRIRPGARRKSDAKLGRPAGL